MVAKYKCLECAHLKCQKEKGVWCEKKKFNEHLPMYRIIRRSDGYNETYMIGQPGYKKTPQFEMMEGCNLFNSMEEAQNGI